MLESEQDAEDAVQELYLKLWKSRDCLNDLHSPVSYGLSLLKNICIDRIRRREVRQHEPMGVVKLLTDASPDNDLASKDLLSLVMEEMERLPEKQAEVMRLMVREGLDYKEISERMRLTQVHVRVLVSAARKTLKQKLKI